MEIPKSEGHIKADYKHNAEQPDVKENKKINNNTIWKIISAVLSIFLLGSFLAGDFSALNTDSITGDAVADQTIEYLNKNILQGQATAIAKDIKESNGLYNLKLSINGREMDSYVTKDGKLLFPQAIDLTTAPQTTSASPASSDIFKSSRPKVELFVMSHCPYGTQIEKGIIPVVKELGDKIYFEIKFVNYAMHGKKELEEQLRQYCIQKEHKDKYLTYLGKFLENGDSQEALNTAGLAGKDLSSCINETDTQYKVTELFDDQKKSEWVGSFPPFKVQDADNKKYGIAGSPTLVINGQQVQSGRDAQSLLDTICGTFTNKPRGCNIDMTTLGNPGPGFGFNTQGGSATAAGCGA
ncbi:MAG: hypothetical protein QT02_C0006G0013 [archaeon GW2011_AR9]|nr:MAG: hypothetical protein QT02_C0006G0013 [archaeon GW2011_AR9]MBS3120470.1 thioredoxin domain-containing protein [Candidatus Woesearchaeota archaeon]HIG92642.1 thioredoxin domain-containing protein [Candidatus Woesearchaeota archaeon]HIH12281.1 thioredoxin domain-containing protein [Candidatus Woesearchaeota archaeon]